MPVENIGTTQSKSVSGDEHPHSESCKYSRKHFPIKKNPPPSFLCAPLATKTSNFSRNPGFPLLLFFIISRGVTLPCNILPELHYGGLLRVVLFFTKVMYPNESPSVPGFAEETTQAPSFSQTHYGCAPFGGVDPWRRCYKFLL
jgi:hypothetical protein